MTTNDFRLADSVLIQIINIVQEAMLTGTDAADHMRMIRLCLDDKKVDTLVLTPQYKVQMELNQKKLLDFAAEHAKVVISNMDANNE